MEPLAQPTTVAPAPGAPVSSDSDSSARDPRVDWARGVASLIMIQGHAFHGWVAVEYRGDPSYLLTRVLATLPLPAFLVMAGTAACYRVRAAVRRGESAAHLRGMLVRRGTQVVAAGYAVSLAYALLDGWESWDVVLRADVLQVVGLSIASLGLCVGGARRPPDVQVITLRAACLGIGVTLACPWLSRWGGDLPPALNPTRPLVGLLVDVPGITRMPLVPLFAWTAAGWSAGAWLTRLGGRAHPRWQLASLGVVACALTVLGHGLSMLAVEEVGGQLSRGHGAVVFNVIEYTGRGLVVLALGPMLISWLPAAARRVAADFGRASLWAYVFHIPFCYGRLGSGLRDRLDVPTATPYVLALGLLSYAVVRVRLLRAPQNTLEGPRRGLGSVFISKYR